MTAIQTLPLTIGVNRESVIVLDALRKQRNLSDYEGDSISDTTLAECLLQAAGGRFAGFRKERNRLDFQKQEKLR